MTQLAVYLSCLLCLTSLHQTSSTFVIAVPTIALTVPTFAVSANLATTLAAIGLVKLKTAALLALTRNRRHAEDNEVNTVGLDQEILWTSVNKMEDDHKCVRRFLCEVATAKLAAKDYDYVIKDLLHTSLDQSADSTKEPYARAAKRGNSHRNVQKCQTDYQCEFTGEEIYNKLNLFGA